MLRSLRPTTDADSAGARSFRVRAALVLLALGTIAYSGLAALENGGDLTRSRKHPRSTASAPSAPGLAASRIGLLAQASDPSGPRASRVMGSDADFAGAEGRRELLNFGAARALQLEYRGEEMPVAALAAGVAQPRALASSDLDRDGAPDLVAGYAHDGAGIVTVQRGNPDAFAPKDDSIFERMQQGYDPDSLLPEAIAYAVPEPVDFLQVGLFDLDNLRDTVVAAKGGGLYLLAGDGAGGFLAPRKVDLPGTVTALAAGEFRAADGRSDIAVGTTGATGPKVLVFDGAAGGFGSEPLTVALKSDSVAIEFGELDSDPFMDLAIAAGREVIAVHGWGRKTHEDIESRIERIPLAFAPRSIALENLVWDREGAREIAVLSADGSVQLLERRGTVKRALSAEETAARAASRGRIARRNEDVETVRGWSTDSAAGWSAAGTFALDAAAGRDAPAQGLLARAKVAPGETNSLLVLNAERRGLDVLGRVDGMKSLREDEAGASDSAELSTTSLAVGGAPVAVVALPRKLNGVRDFAVLKSGFVGPSIVPQGVTATIVVDRTDDTAAASACTGAANDCSLRGAVLFANATPGTAISLPAGTYNLTIIGNTNNMGAGEGFSGNPSIGDLDFLGDATTVTGAGSATTIIRQTTANDRTLEPNSLGDLNFDWAISAVTITGGRDTGGSFTGGGGAFLSGSKDNTTSVTNCVVSNNWANGAGTTGGGGISNQGGSLTVTNSTIGGATTVAACASQSDVTCGNQANPSSGGGLGFSPGDPFIRIPSAGTLTVTGTSFTNNLSNSGGAGGGGADLFAHNSGTGSATIETSTFTSNVGIGTASGGGIIVESLATTVMTSSFTSNSAGNRGGAIYVGGASLTLDGTGPSITMTGNTAGAAGSTISTAGAVNVLGTNTTLGGDIEVTTGGSWNNGAGSVIAPTNVVVEGGTFNTGSSTVNMAGNLSIQAAPVVGGTFNGGSGTVNIGGNFTLGTGGSPATSFNAGTGTFNFNGAGAQAINGPGTPTFNNLTKSGAGTLTLGVNTPVASNLTVSAGIFDLLGFTANRTALGGTLTVANGATLKIGGSGSMPSNYSTYSLGATSTVEYKGTVSQTIAAVNYGHLTSSSTGGRVLAPSGTIGIAGMFTPGTNAYTITGSTVNFNGGGSQTIPAFAYNNLSSSGAGARTLPAAGIVKIAGVFTPGTNAYTITLSTVEYNGTSLQTLPSGFTTYNNLTLNNAAGTTGFVGLTVQSLLRAQQGTFTSSSSYNDVQIDSGATLAGTNATTINVAGNWTNNGTFTANGNTVVFNGNGNTQNISGSSATAFNNFTSNHSGAGGVSLGTGMTVNGLLTLTSGNITTNANTLSVGASGTRSRTGGHIIGNEKKTYGGAGSFTFDVGTANGYSPVDSTVTAGTGDLTVRAVQGPQPDLTANMSLQRYWTLTEGGAGITANLLFHYLDPPDVMGTEADYQVIRVTGGVPTEFASNCPGAPCVDEASNTFSVDGVTAFSDWTAGAVPPDVNVAVSPASVAEDGATNLVYTFTRVGEATTNALTVNFSVGGTASFTGGDYTQTGAATFTDTTGTVTFGAGNTTATVTIDPSSDSTVEPDETAILTVTNGTGYEVGAPAAATGTIANDDTDVSVAVSPASTPEDGATNLVYTFTRAGVTTGALTVNFSIGGTATFGVDYTQTGAATFLPPDGTVIFGAGSSTATVTIDPSADVLVEPDETVVLMVAAGAGYDVGSPDSATGTIANDDAEVTLAVSPSSVDEDGATNLVYTFTRTGFNAAPLTVNFTIGGTATFGTDYSQTGAATFVPPNGTVIFAALSSTATVTVDPSADGTAEPDETVVLTIAAGTGYTAGTPDSATGTIANDDNAVSVAVSPASTVEDGATNLVYTFTRTDPAGTLTVNFSVGGTATFSADYTQTGAATFVPPNGTVGFADGSATATVTIDPTADSTVEPDETVVLTVTAGTGYGIGSPDSAAGTITNDDTDVSVAVSPAAVDEDGATNLVYTFTRIGVTTGALTVSFSVGGTADFGTDYTETGAATFGATSGTVDFGAGASTAIVTLDPTVDGVIEPDETAVLTVVPGTGYNVGSPDSATGTIANDDPDVTVAMSSAAPDPTNTSPIPVTAQFSEDVTGFTAGDVVAGNATVGNFVAVDGDTYTFDLTPTGQGLVTADIAAGVAQDADGNGNTAAAQFSRTFDSMAPTVAMSSAAPDPTNTSPIPVTAQFNEDVTGFAAGDVVAGNATVGNFVAVDGDTYTFDLTPTGQGLVTADIAAGVAQDAAGNGNTAAAQLSRTFDTLSPAVTINQAAGQADPTSGSPIHFTAVFNEPVSGFGDAAADVTVGGTAGATTAVVTQIAPNDGTTYDVAVSGMTMGGMVTAMIPAGAANDAAGNGSSASTSTDKTVTFIPNQPPTVVVAPGGLCSEVPNLSGRMNLTVADDMTPAGSLVLSATSSNTSVVPNGNITLGGSGANRTITVRPVPQKNSQSSTITITVQDANGATASVTIRVFVGTNKKDTINASSGADMVFGLNGDDTVNAGAGNDLVCTGNGNGTINGGADDDTLDGGNGNDVIRGDAGNDILIGGSGNDTLTGGTGADFFSGGPGSDTATDFNAGQGDTTDGSIP